jgi:hypothetical protein
LKKYGEFKENPNRVAFCLEKGMAIVLGTYENGHESGKKQTPWKFRVKLKNQKIYN